MGDANFCARRFLAVALLSLLVGCASRATTSAPLPPNGPTPDYSITTTNARTWSSRAETMCLHGCPEGAPQSNRLIVRKAYALSNNGTTKFADWVAYVVRPENIKRKDSRNFEPDPDLPPDETLEDDDYDFAFERQGYHKGHQAPLASFGATDYWEETNLLSNITPQKSDLNSGRWLQLENAERKLAQEDDVAVYVITGPLYLEGEDLPELKRADEEHEVPSGYWKVVSLKSGEATGFIFYQKHTLGKFCAHRASIKEIEDASGLDLFPQSGDAPVRSLAKLLGCTRTSGESLR